MKRDMKQRVRSDNDCKGNGVKGKGYEAKSEGVYEANRDENELKREMKRRIVKP